MNLTSLRLSIVSGVVIVGALASGAAFADIQASTSGGELFLVAENTSGNSTFVVGLGTAASSVFTAPTTTSPQNAPLQLGFTTPGSLSMSSAAATALSSFITTAGTNLQWTIVGAEQTSAGASATVQNSMSFLGLLPSAPFSGASQVSNSTLATQWNGIDTWVNDLNAIVIATGNPLDGASGTATGYYSTYANGNAALWFANTNNAATKLNQAYNFYAMSIGTGGTAGKGNLYQAGFQLSLTNSGGVAAINVIPAAVPLPAAVWLLGSGLLGLVGIGRRRSARVA